MFCHLTEKSRQKFKYLENKKSFWGEIKTSFHDFKRAFNCQKLSFKPFLEHDQNAKTKSSISWENIRTFFGRWESDFQQTLTWKVNVTEIFSLQNIVQKGVEKLVPDFYKKSKLSISLDQQSKMLYSLFLLYVQVEVY